MKKKALEKVVADILSPQGFHKKSLTWYREREDALQLIDLQKSSYGDQFYLNICFVPVGMSVEGLPYPKESKCPIRIRLTALFPDEKSKFDSFFDIENGEISDSARTLGIEEIFTKFILPCLSKLEKSGLKSAVECDYFNGGAVNIATKKHFRIASES